MDGCPQRLVWNAIALVSAAELAGYGVGDRVSAGAGALAFELSAAAHAVKK
jgi:hypothetical protein